MDINLMRKELIRDEGVRNYPYKDTVGKLTIGVGRNLDGVGIHDDEAYLMLANDIQDAMRSLDKHLPWWRELAEVRQRVLVNMCFNLGITGLLGFKNTLAMIKTGKYTEAAAAMLNSKWAGQVGARAQRLAEQMAKGE